MKNKEIKVSDKERNTNLARHEIGKKGFFDHGAIDTDKIGDVIRMLFGTHTKDEMIRVFKAGLTPQNLKSKLGFSWEVIAEDFEKEFAKVQFENYESLVN
jgi:hypothetical protein